MSSNHSNAGSEQLPNPAVPTRDDDDPEDSLSANEIKQVRANNKRALTNYLKVIDYHIVNKDSRSGLQVHRTQLCNLQAEVERYHNLYTEKLGLNDAEKLEADAAYLLPIDRTAQDMFNRIQVYLDSRIDDAPSSVHSTATSKRSSVNQKFSVHALQLQIRQAARRRREEEELAANTAALEEQKREADRKLEEAMRNAEFDRQQRELEEQLELQRLKDEVDEDSSEDDAAEPERRERRQEAPVHTSTPRATSAHVPSTFVVKTRALTAGLSSRKPPANPNQWIGNRISGSLPQSTSDALLSLLPRHKLKEFSGDPLQWPFFISSFKDLVHDVIASDSTRLSILQSHLSDTVKEEIGGALSSPDTYWEYLDELVENYGHPHLVALAHVNTVLSTPSIAEHDSKSIASFCRKLRGVVKALSCNGYSSELSSGITLAQLVQILPRSFQSRWGRLVYSQLNKKTLTIVDLAEWLHHSVMGDRMVSLSNRKSDSLKGAPSKKDKKDKKEKGRPEGRSHPSPTIMNTSSKPASSKCFACDQPFHHIFKCDSFGALNANARADLVKTKKRCFKCFSAKHASNACTTLFRCKVEGCGKEHHTLLHGAEESKMKVNIATGTAVITCHHLDTATDELTGLVSVVKVVLSNKDRTITTYALLDPGAETSLITEDIISKLHLAGTPSEIRFGTFRGVERPTTTKIVSFLASRPGDELNVIGIKAFSVDSINASCRRMSKKMVASKWPHLADVPLTVPSGKVTVLIGSNVPYAHLQLEVRLPPHGIAAPYGIRTPLGWSLFGRVPSVVSPVDLSPEEIKLFAVSTSPSLSEANPPDDLHEIVQQFMKLESVGIVPRQNVLSEKEQRAVDIVKSTTKYLGDRYEAGLPWVSDDVFLQDNRDYALHRFRAVERRFNRDPAYAVYYQKAIEEYEALGFSRKLSLEELNQTRSRKWYLPHHGVLNPHKPGRVRVVFDASAEFHRKSLNRCLLTGPNLLNDITTVITRFRQRAIPVSADIAKMFHQVRVIKEDQPALRYLWRPPGSVNPPDTYQMGVQVFGAVSSPYVCASILQQTAEDFYYQFPEAADKVKSNFYVDNYVDSFDTLEEAIAICHQLIELLKAGGFPLTQWLSSSRELLATLPPSDWIEPNLNLDFDGLPSQRTLGIMFHAATDTFQFDVNPVVAVPTKREVLRQVASVFDPIGFLCPLTMRARCLLQQAWTAKINWDESIPVPLLKSWNKWTRELVELKGLSIPRCLTASIITEVQLHIFSDASEQAYASVAYLRHQHPNDPSKFHVSFVQAKSRVAPIRPVSIPRLELQANVLGVRLSLHCRQSLEFKITSTIYWTDSKTTLQWISSSTCRFHPFVGHRVGEIRDESAADQWRYVPGKENPADDATRGLSVSALNSNHRWLRGPAFLYLEEKNWPKMLLLKEPDKTDPEVKPIIQINTIFRSTIGPVTELIEKFSHLSRLKRVMAWILRFIARCKKSKRFFASFLSSEELDAGLTCCIRIAQRSAFPEEVCQLSKGRSYPRGSRIVNLLPFLEDAKLLRSNGRLNRSSLPYDTKNPVILPPSHRITSLIIHGYHLRLFHASAERTLCELRQNYWVVQQRRTVHRVIHDCRVCRRARTKPVVPLMAPLPPERLTPGEGPFTSTGIDYFGHLTVTVGRRTEKRYICLFTCLATKTFHLKVSFSMDVNSFLCAYRRFTARRGNPRKIFSDNGSNFFAGERELREGLERWNQESIQNHMA